MPKKTKILLSVISFLCFCSLLLNVLLLGNNANMDHKVFNGEKSFVDSITNEILVRDTIVERLQASLEEAKGTLESQLKEKGEENTKLRREIDSLKEKIKKDK